MLRTAEFVSPGHPDKLCDRIADSILDVCISQDKNTRAAIEVMGGHKLISVTGEITTEAFVNVQETVRKITGDNCGVQVNIVRQSPEIANGVDTGGAGDQGIMIGYACNENKELMPQEAYLARSLNRYLYAKHPFDGKTQVTLRDNDIVALVASFQLTKTSELKSDILEWAKEMKLDISKSKLHVNPAGEWNVGGFDADTGVTGRKLAVDNYGPRIPLGGGSFSGKDSTKVDRSGAYMARRVAVDYLKKHNAKEVYV
jgi:S-adenosylmethionine synthetase